MHEEMHPQIYERLGAIDAGIKAIVEQQKIANGRTSKLEDKSSHLEDIVILLQERDSNGQEEKKRSQKWQDFLRENLIRLVFAIIGVLVLVVLQKTDIVNLSIVSDEKFDKINN